MKKLLDLSNHPVGPSKYIAGPSLISVVWAGAMGIAFLSLTLGCDWGLWPALAVVTGSSIAISIFCLCFTLSAADDRREAWRAFLTPVRDVVSCTTEFCRRSKEPKPGP